MDRTGQSNCRQLKKGRNKMVVVVGCGGGRGGSSLLQSDLFNISNPQALKLAGSHGFWTQYRHQCSRSLIGVAQERALLSLT